MHGVIQIDWLRNERFERGHVEGRVTARAIAGRDCELHFRANSSSPRQLKPPGIKSDISKMVENISGTSGH